MMITKSPCPLTVEELISTLQSGPHIDLTIHRPDQTVERHVARLDSRLGSELLGAMERSDDGESRSTDR